MRLKILAYLGICAVIFAACSDEQTDISITGGKDVQVHLDFRSAEMQEAGSSSRSSGEVVLSLGGGNTSSTISSPMDTRSYNASDINDATISNLWVFQYANGVFVRKQYFSKVDMADFNVDLSSNISGQTSNLYFIANVGADAFPNSLATEDAFKANSLKVTDESSLFPSLGYIPMSGCLADLSIPDDFKGGKTVTLTSMLARVDFSYTLSSDIPNGFNLKYVRLVNIPDGSFPYVASDATTFPINENIKVKSFDYEVIPGNSMTFYLPDNRRGDGSNEGGEVSGKSGIRNATCIQLIGYLNGNEFIYNIYPGKDEINNYDIVRNTHYTIKANITGIYGTDARVTETPLSNAYMIKPGDCIHIPVKRANQTTELGEQLADITSGWHSEVIWRDNSSLTITNDDALKSAGFFEVKAADATACGNALVCIKDDAGKIFWSWHIWVTDYDPDTDNETYNNFTWMDRNLGATNDTPGDVGALGLMYQWGRKDPFPGASTATYDVESAAALRSLYAEGSGNTTYSGITAVSTFSRDNLANSTQHPNLFYISTTERKGDWYVGSNGTQNNALWGATKTVYDPCPQGWKVPAEGSWAESDFGSWDTTYGGRTINSVSGSWYPSGGYLSPTTMTFVNVGALGCYWTSTVSDTSAYYLYFLNSRKVPNGSTNRAAGQSVRCIKE